MAVHLAAVVENYGRPEDVIRLARRPRPDLAPGMVEIAIERAAVNPSDLIPVTGAYSNRTVLPFVPGFEGVGTVSRIGAGVSGLKSGDRVLPLGASGLWQSYVQRPAEWCFAVPDDLSADQATTAYINPMTTLRLIAELKAHFGGSYGLSGRRIGVTAAGSAIGRMLLMTLSAEGAEVIAIVRSEATAARLPALPGLQTWVTGQQLAGKDVVFDALVDAVGGETGGHLLRHHLSPGGAFLQYGALSGAPIAQSAISARPDVRFSFLWLRSFIHAAGRQAISNALAQCFDGIRDGSMVSHIAATYPLSRLDEALVHQSAPDRRGKILLDPRC
ncbi:oxidoreductase [Rhizobium sp. Root73]|uniref:zinc-dependent alcohol dehydrogenase family protein n=1 Tax=Rhizobium sp. Root73 TaxID=1736596 RepID=UPI00071570FB|nr:zinc-dependent alcohol dehydrogenase family protein [Rhizobium sp. Root73]KQV34187.1 oxidoreductase [Rhizobium sp. Root1204]KQY17515.1 oxidoreductase [Rhizobium sp. Root1334]KRC13397.1 oxidoreductase [Rhizobium sp. Root73]